MERIAFLSLCTMALALLLHGLPASSMMSTAQHPNSTTRGPSTVSQIPNPGEERIQFSFSGYGNPQRPFPGYVGPFQLGPVHISGSGEIRAKDGALLSGGRITHSDNLLDRRYPTHGTTWQVVKGLGVQRAGATTVLRLQVRVFSSNYLNICPVGTLGIIELIDDNSRLTNGYPRDGIRTEVPNPSSLAPDGGLACRTHSHGMNNTDVSWTDPPRGGPPSGGIWAIVEIGGASSFEITSVSLPPRVKLNGPREALRVYWTGTPTFPVEMVFAPDTCPPGLTCTLMRKTFTASANPLVFEGAVWCIGQFSSPIFFDYSVYLVDATGKRTKLKNADVTCNP
jgi:hypothetical protein